MGKLELLNKNDYFELLKNNKLKYGENIIYKDYRGKNINIQDLSQEEYLGKYFINKYSGEIEEIILIKDKKRAKEFNKKFKEILDERNNFELLDIKNEDIFKILEECFELDQNMRKDGKINSKIDNKNLQLVVSILEKNIEYLLKNGVEKDFRAIFFIIQHGNLKFQKKYINIFTNLSKEGKLKKKDLALMVDRILMNEGKPQKYGTQYIKNKVTGKLELYKIEDLEDVNELRKSIGLRTLEEQNKLIEL